MAQLICTVAEALAANGFTGIKGWLATWFAYTCFTYLVITALQVAWFRYFFCLPTYDKWRWKTNPKYPAPVLVLGEIILGTLIANPSVTLVPSIHLALVASGPMRHHCDTPLTWQYRLYSLAVVILVVDVYNWFWHYLGHAVGSLWSVHKHHHHFANPTPFSTIADMPPDNIMRSMYMVVANVASILLVGMPVDIDVIYVGSAGVVSMYGIYLHCGHEFSWLPADHKHINTSFQHFAHHALSYKNKPYHTGFFFKFWDKAAGSVYEGKALIPAVEDQKLGNRERERWEREIAPGIPDYSVLASPAFWRDNFVNTALFAFGLGPGHLNGSGAQGGKRAD